MTNYPIYCINLEHRTDRKKHSAQQFKKLDILHTNVIYPYFIKDTRGGVYGCFDSHIKVWAHFFKNYPHNKYCLVFEDDFVSNTKSINIINKATRFINNNYAQIDILFLHNIRVAVKDKLNNNTFTRGYGLGAHAYIINRHYIQSIIDKWGQLPGATGFHFDFQLSMDIINCNNKIYSTKLFYTNSECITQLIDKSDNYVNLVDRLTRYDVNMQLKYFTNFAAFIKGYNLLNDIKIKYLACVINKLQTIQLTEWDITGITHFLNQSCIQSIEQSGRHKYI